MCRLKSMMVSRALMFPFNIPRRTIASLIWDALIRPFSPSPPKPAFAAGAEGQGTVSLLPPTMPRPVIFTARLNRAPGRLFFGLYKVPDTGVDIILKISLDRSPREIAPQPVRTNPVRKGAGWYKGDLHCHTFHSDAKGSPELLHAAAKQAGLDFLAVSDHNTISQRRYFYPNSSPDLLFIRAFEITTAEGHANVFGTDEWIDFRMTSSSDSHRLAEEVHKAGGILSINHDKPEIPWQYEIPANLDCMEVWQSSWMLNNWVSLQRYQERLAAGMRLSCLGGSDYHQPDRLLPEGPLVLARPTTVLWLDELSEDEVLKALKSGHGYVTEAPDGPGLILRANGKTMGDIVSGESEIVSVTAATTQAEGDLLYWYDATGLIKEQEIKSNSWIGNYKGKVNRFIRAEIIARQSYQKLINQLPKEIIDNQQPIRRALSNPIYVSP